MVDDSLAGIFAPALTPLDADLEPDRESFVRFCRWLLSQDVGLAIFGTNSEANSLSVSERLDLLDGLIDAGLPPQRMMPGVRLCGAAAKAGTAAVLMLPPFYYKPVSDAGLFAFYAETIERVGDARLKICLYHIPQVSGVPITLELIAKLTGRYPETVVGIKDSGGKFENTKAMLERFPGFRVFCGSERFLTDTARHGGAGCISALANVNAAAITEAWRRREEPCAETRQRALSAIRDIFEDYVVIPALKETVACFGACASFRFVRPPLLPLGPEQSRALNDRLLAAGFEMPELRQALAR
jgi:4-hydroxy-tetrahydrodipicolinate synthase